MESGVALAACKPRHDIMISINSYTMLALLDMSAMAFVPLVWSMPIDPGGLGFSPASIGPLYYG
jgi:hypothetical protein